MSQILRILLSLVFIILFISTIVMVFHVRDVDLEDVNKNTVVVVSVQQGGN